MMTKKTFLATMLSVLTMAAYAQQYVVNGTAPAGARTVYLTPIGEEAADSAAVDAKGTFTFRGDAKGKHLAYVSTKGEDAVRFAVFLEGNVSVDLVKLTATGGEENKGLSAYQEFVSREAQPIKEVVSKLMAKRNSGQELTEQDLASYYDLVEQISPVIMERARTDLKNNASMRWPAYIVTDNMGDMEHDFLISLDTPANVYMSEPCMDKVKTLIAAYRRTQVGQKFADFEMADTAGVKHKLSEFVGRGTYVLIDFWATWCGPCMRELPNVKALYDKYHAKGFDIVGVSFDNDGESWRAVIKRKNMNWTHLSDLGGWKSLPVDFYGVRAIPYTMLISPDGTILETELAGEKLAEKLAELFD